MANDPNQPVVLTSVPNEGLANMIKAALEERGIAAYVQGGLTAGFRAEVPGEVQVLVRRSDVEAARGILQALSEEETD